MGCFSEISAPTPVTFGGKVSVSELGGGPGEAGQMARSGSWAPCVGVVAAGRRAGEFLLLDSHFPVFLNTHLMSSDQSINLICSVCSLPAAIFSLV